MEITDILDSPDIIADEDMHPQLFSHYTADLIEAGLDEAGRGCLAGPVVAAAVILPKDYHHPLLRDSKKLTAKQRTRLREEIIREAIAYGIGEASSLEIDEINILQASIVAMHRAVAQLPISPGILLVDGKYFKPYQQVPHHCVVRGDNTFFSIAAASVLAKTYRDDLMRQLAEQYPYYGWEKNAAYPTPAHYHAIFNYGITPFHRRSFRLIREGEW